MYRLNKDVVGRNKYIEYVCMCICIGNLARDFSDEMCEFFVVSAERHWQLLTHKGIGL